MPLAKLAPEIDMTSSPNLVPYPHSGANLPLRNLTAFRGGVNFPAHRHGNCNEMGGDLMRPARFEHYLPMPWGPGSRVAFLPPTTDILLICAFIVLASKFAVN